jgi:hypothetical protein
MNFPVIDSACHVWVDDPKYPFAKQPAGATPWTQVSLAHFLRKQALNLTGALWPSDSTAAEMQ